MDKLKCIHGRTEKQKCALCNFRSDCCDAPVYRISPKAYQCEKCGKAITAYKEK